LPLEDAVKEFTRSIDLAGEALSQTLWREGSFARELCKIAECNFNHGVTSSLIRRGGNWMGMDASNGAFAKKGVYPSRNFENRLPWGGFPRAILE
jgi:hypothetical protein